MARGRRTGRPGAIGRRGVAASKRVVKAVGVMTMLRAPDAGTRSAAAMTGAQLVGEVERREEVAFGNTYAIAVALMELSKPARYKDELGFESVEELLEAKGLSSRMTAHKHVTVVNVLSEKNVRWIGGMEKSYLLIRWVLRQDEAADPRKVLEPGFRVAGKLVQELSVRELREALRKLAMPADAPPPATAATTKRGARRLRGAFRKVRIATAVRAHTQDAEPHVSARRSEEH